MIDIVSILLYAPFRFERYMAILKSHKKEPLISELSRAIREFNPAESEHYLGIDYKEFAKRKKNLLEKIKALK